jgi:hypothetical protein
MAVRACLPSCYLGGWTDTQGFLDPEDFEFFGGDPRAPPPQNLDDVGHLNTGQAFVKTHAKLCMEEGDQALAVPMAIDRASISQFHSMELIAFKIALEIF